MGKYKYYLGIDLGATKIRTGVVNDLGIVSDIKELSTKKKDRLSLVNQIYDLIKVYIENYDFTGIGIGTPGIVDYTTGDVVGMTVNLKNWQGVSLKKTIESKFKIETKVENDVILWTMGELLNKKNFMEKSNFACVVLGTGVGVGVVIENAIIRSVKEFGHTIVKFDGRKCRCGKIGCIEAYGSGTGMKENYSELLQLNGYPKKQVDFLVKEFDLTKLDNKIAEKVFNNFLDAISCLILNVNSILSIDEYIFTGGISDFFFSYSSKLSNRIKELWTPIETSSIKLIKSSLSQVGALSGIPLLFNDEN